MNTFNGRRHYSHIYQPEDCIQMLNRLLKNIAIPISVGDNTAHVTASIGIARFPTDGLDAETLLNLADQAMYHAKQQGKSHYHFASVASIPAPSHVNASNNGSLL